MEVIAIASTVCALCKGIQAWIDQHAEKDAMLSQLLSSIIQIHNILLPFTTAKFQGTGELQLADCISSIGDLLQRTKKHLRIWDYKRTQKIVAYLNPTAVIKQLKEDATAINNHLIILLTSLAVVGYFRDHHTKDTANATSASNIAPISKSTQPVGPLHQLVDPGAREFWSDYVGAKIHFVAKDLFCERLIMWTDGSLSKPICDRIVMRLDDYDTGRITPNNLARVLGREPLEGFVMRCSQEQKPSAIDPSLTIITPGGPPLQTPLLVWIDDRPQNNAYEVAQARSMGVFVVELSSTSVAKAWVEANSAFLNANDHPSRLRFISDNVRLESSREAGSCINPTAGESFLRFLRGRFFDAPVLIYTGRTIDETRYVERYGNAGSTTYAKTCLGYITGLAAGKDDTGWCGYNSYLVPA